MQARPLSFKEIKQRKEQDAVYAIADQYVNHIQGKLKSIDEEMQLAGFSPEQILTVKTHGQCVSLVTDSLKNIGSIPPGTTVLGLEHKAIVASLSCILKCDDYSDAYFRIYGCCLEAKPDFMQRLTDENNEIIFLVPRKLFNYTHGVTRQEIEWLLSHPQAMNKVKFVFGAYKIYPKKMINLSIRFFPHYCAERIFSRMLSSEAQGDRSETRNNSSPAITRSPV